MNDEALRAARRSILLALGGFLVGAFTVAVLVWNFGNMIGSRAASRANPIDVPSAMDRWGTLEPLKDSVPPLDTATSATGGAIPTTGMNLPSNLRARALGVPVLGVAREDLRESFTDARSGARVHEAMDILASRNTPVVAVEDGRVARLFFSKAGGITVYQFDPTEQYCYYYAHLERYADNLKEGDYLRRGQVIGYVGTSGNAPAETPHLHFAIFRLSDKKRWWEGEAIDPYGVLH